MDARSVTLRLSRATTAGAKPRRLRSAKTSFDLQKESRQRDTPRIFTTRNVLLRERFHRVPNFYRFSERYKRRSFRRHFGERQQATRNPRPSCGQLRRIDPSVGARGMPRRVLRFVFGYDPSVMKPRAK